MKVCFVGIGSIAKRHIRNLRTIYAERSESLHIDALRHTSGNLPDGVDLDDIYTDSESLPKDYDIIFLTNPTEYHAEMLRVLHDHGRHFFIEKPVASLKTMELLHDIPYRPDSVYYVAGPLRYNNVIQYVKKHIDPSAVNAVRCISSSYLPDWRPGIDYRQTYSAHSDLGGGVSIDLIHEWDYLTDIFGLPKAVHMFKGKVSQLEIDSDDYAIYIAQYENMTAEVHLDYFGRKTIRKIEIYTDDDTIEGDIITGTITYQVSGKKVDLSEGRDSYQIKELLYFLDLISSGSYKNYVMPAVKVLNLTQGMID